MSKQSRFGLDLSRLPPEMRQKIEQRMATMSPEARAKWQGQGGPVLARLFNALSAREDMPAPPPVPGTSQWRETPRADTGTTSPDLRVPTPKAPHNPRIEALGHFNQTVRPGDKTTGGLWLVAAMVLLLGAAFLWP